MKRFLCLISLVVVASSIKVDLSKSECTTNADCSPDHCCVKNERYMIFSKRQDIDYKDIDWEGGQCVSYVKEGESCHDLGFTSCGCTPGLKCNYYPTGVGRRDMLFRPGNSFCEKA